MLCLCALLVIAAFFVRDFVLYDFHLEPSDYTYQRTDQARPEGAASDVWFTYGADRALQYGISDGIRETAIQLYAKTTDGAQAIAALSRQFISQDGYIGGFNLRLAAQLAMSGIGIVLTVRWLLERRKERHACCGCHSCGKPTEKAGILPMLCAGLTYGFTPCAPLLMMIGYSFPLPVPLAGATRIAFGLASMASPVLLLTAITGALSKKMRREISGCTKWFRLGFLSAADRSFLYRYVKEEFR